MDRGKPNHYKVAEMLALSIPSSYIEDLGANDSARREKFKSLILQRSWAAFGRVLTWVESKGFTWEIETHPDAFCEATLFSEPDDLNNMQEIVRDQTYGEMQARLSCVCGAIVINKM